MSPISNRAHKGGTAIIIPQNQLGLQEGETLHDADSQVRLGMASAGAGRVTSIHTHVEGRLLVLTAAYAPSAPGERQAFFTNILQPFVDSETVLGIDANCVPDVSLDVRSSARISYENTGANELQSVIDKADLIDIAREWLGNAPFFTWFF
jgi:hypothetical protein